MANKKALVSCCVAALFGLGALAGCASDPLVVSAEGLRFGVILGGDANTDGASVRHAEGLDATRDVTGAIPLVVEEVNPVDRPGTPVDEVVSDLIAQGADLVVATDASMGEGIKFAAELFPELPMVWIGGDSAWPDGEHYRPDLVRLANLSPRLTTALAIGGCAAALRTVTGSIAYVGTAPDHDTLRQANAAFLGSRRCFADHASRDVDALDFTVAWTEETDAERDPVELADSLLDDGTDVVILGFEDVDALIRVGQRSAAGEQVWAVAFNDPDACDLAPEVCLGVPFVRWEPVYEAIIAEVADGRFPAGWTWLPAVFDEASISDDSPVAFTPGPALGDHADELDAYVAAVAAGDIDVFAGPLAYANGDIFVAEGQTATDIKLWYTEGLLAGIDTE